MCGMVPRSIKVLPCNDYVRMHVINHSRMAVSMPRRCLFGHA